MTGQPPGTETKELDMDTSINRLTAAAGLCATAAGAIFVAVQINHPPLDVEHIVSGEYAVRESAKALMAALALAGFTGLLVRHRRHFGVLGYVGYVLLSIGYLAMFAVQCIAGYVLPIVARTDPAYVQDVLDAGAGGTPAGDIGHMQQVFLASGIGFAIGGLLFGIALFRAAVLPRWASALFAYGTVSALALSVLPDSFNRPFAVPVGVALMGLGIALWREQREASESVDLRTPAGVTVAST